MESKRRMAAMLLAAVVIGSSASACSPGSDAGSVQVDPVCAAYSTMRPLVAKVLEMNAKVGAGGRSAGAADAAALISAIDLIYPDAPSPHPNASARYRGFASHVYKLALDIRMQANAVADSSYPLDLTIGELTVRQDAHNLDEFSSGSDGGSAMCSSMTIPSPYPAALPPA
jgi:hypothetical protein